MVNVRRSALDVVRVRQHRIVCSCGHVTQWRRDLARARKLAAGHTIDGQQSVT